MDAGLWGWSAHLSGICVVAPWTALQLTHHQLLGTVGCQICLPVVFANSPCYQTMVNYIYHQRVTFQEPLLPSARSVEPLHLLFSTFGCHPPTWNSKCDCGYSQWGKGFLARMGTELTLFWSFSTGGIWTSASLPLDSIWNVMPFAAGVGRTPPSMVWQISLLPRLHNQWSAGF